MHTSAASRVIWVGRATVFLVGLALILALLSGVASTALVHEGDKGFFHLAHKNAAQKMSALVRQGAGPALNLQVESGPPLRVNSSDKVTNLNADQLDGKSETDFYAAGSKVADSEKLEGKAASDFAAAYKRAVVSPVRNDAQNGQALLDALSGITDASAAKQYLLYIEPGTYDLGNGSLRMKEHVDIQGGGELKTLITSGISASGCMTGTVRGANNAGLRFLTVRNTASSSCGAAIHNSSSSPRLTHMMADATGSGASNVSVFNSASSPIMVEVTAIASGGSVENVGVAIPDGSPTMVNVTAAASGGDSRVGVSSSLGNPTIRQSKLSGASNSLMHVGPSSTLKVALTQLERPVTKGASATLQCFNNIDQNLAAVTCP